MDAGDEGGDDGRVPSRVNDGDAETRAWRGMRFHKSKVVGGNLPS